ncbi:MAG: hypothetical protein Q7S83_03030 [bacterium]|nr:hypothetical protein [bacterium]
MKSTLKIIFVVLVILGLVGSYVLAGIPIRQPAQTPSNFEGPTGEPSTKGPSEAPPVK